MPHPIYHLDFAVRSCRAEVRLNDVFLAELTSNTKLPATFAPPLNPWLVGEFNVLDVTLYPVGSADAVSSFWDAEFAGAIRRYEKGETVVPGEGDEPIDVVIPEELKERVREEELELPQAFSHVFSNDVVDFGAELNAGPTLDDRDALLDYGARLLSLATSGDAGALLAEWEPKIAVWAKAYDEPVERMRESMQGDFAEFFRLPVISSVSRSDLDLAPHAGGRIWEIRTKGGDALLRNEPPDDPEAGYKQYRVFAAMRDGHLRVVR